MDINEIEKQTLEELAALEKQEKKEEEPALEQEEAEPELPQEEEASQADKEGEEEEEEEDLADGAAPKEKKAWAKMRKTLKEEKTRNDELARQLQEMRERQARLEGMQQAAPQKQQEQRQEDAEPDRDLDPDDWRDWKIRQQDKQIQQIIGTTQQASEAVRVQNELRGLEILEQRYAAQDAEYQNKISFLKKIEGDKLRLLQPNITDEQIEAAIARDKLIIAKHAYEKLGRNPAEIFAAMAEKQGYTAQQKSPPKKRLDVETINKNMRKNASVIGGTSAAPAGDEISPHELLSMSIEKMARIPEERLKRIMSNIE